MWAFGKASRLARLEGSPCSGMVEDKFEKVLESHIQMFGIKFEGSCDHRRHLDIGKIAPPKKKIVWNVIFHSKGHFAVSNGCGWSQDVNTKFQNYVGSIIHSALEAHFPYPDFSPN